MKSSEIQSLMLISFCYKLGMTYSEKSVLVLNCILIVFSDMYRGEHVQMLEAKLLHCCSYHRYSLSVDQS